MVTAGRTRRWYRLDNAARIFAALASRRTTTVFRVAATLTDRIDDGVLQDALDTVMPRFPCYRVRLRAGLFWHYLEEVSGRPLVQEERLAPCRPMVRARDGSWLFRVLTFGRRIAVEFSHVLTDGAGALSFLQTLVAEYLARKGLTSATDGAIHRPTATPHPEEAEDSYRRFYDPSVPPPRREERAYRLHTEPLPVDQYRVLLGSVPMAALRDLSRKHTATVTELLTAVLLAAFLDHVQTRRARARRPLRVMVPVNLRKLFPSRTMRNFFLPVTAGIDPRLG